MSKRKAAKKLPTFDQLDIRTVNDAIKGVINNVIYGWSDSFRLWPEYVEFVDNLSRFDGHEITRSSVWCSMIGSGDGKTEFRESRMWHLSISVCAYGLNGDPTIREYCGGQIEISQGRIRELLAPHLEQIQKAVEKRQSMYVSRLLDRNACNRNRSTGAWYWAMTAGRNILTDEGKALEYKLTEWLGEPVQGRGFLKDGSVWFRFIIGEWMTKARGRWKRVNDVETYVETPGKPMKGTTEEDLMIVRDRLLDEGYDATIKEQKYGEHPSKRIVVGPVK